MEEEVLSRGRVVGPFIIDELLEKGDTCNIYIATDPNTRKKYVLKLESIDSKAKTLEIELENYALLKGSKYFPIIHSNGSTQNWRYISMELLGPTIEKFQTILKGKTYSRESTVKISRQMLCCIQELHEKNIIHGEIHSKHFVIKLDATFPITLLDLNKAWLTTSRPPPKQNTKKKIHQDKIYSRRNDLLNWFYTTLILIDGKLPWSSLTDHKKIEQMKNTVTIPQLCASLPDDYQQIYSYIINLKNDEKPDYNRILQLINTAMIKARSDQSEFEWITMDSMDVAAISKIDLVSQVTSRPNYKTSDPLPKPFYKTTVIDDTIMPPRKKQQIVNHAHPEDLKQLNVEAYRTQLPEDPFPKGYVGKLPESPKKEEAPQRKPF